VTRRHAASDRPPTLSVRDLTVEFALREGRARVVDRVGLEVWPGEIVGLIGESGSGKTITAMTALGLAPKRSRVTSGSVALSGRELLTLSPSEMRALRGDRIALIPQDAMRALNPTMRVGVQVGEPLELHRRSPWAAAKAKAVELLGAVHLRQPEVRAAEYPHQFSGGMQQRAMIAMGLALSPELLIADEPTTALDVTVQAQVLTLLREIRDRSGTSILVITHDLGVVAALCDWVYVMYAGAIMESGPVDRLFSAPGHPYTRALLKATPTVRSVVEGELAAIPGQIPSPLALPPGCRFADRCALRIDRCREPPPLEALGADQAALCWRAGEAA
jgi:oligopeptide/dipeptide ABC transporter ATP-binding protein